MKKKALDKYEKLNKILIKRKTVRKAQKQPKTEKSSKRLEQYALTPQGILYFHIDQFIQTYLKLTESKSTSIDDIFTAFKDFQKRVLADLSRLATNDADSTMFGMDFNEFFSEIIRCINLCGAMKQKLEELGIDFDLNDGDTENDKRA